jgi:hypothetical protein
MDRIVTAFAKEIQRIIKTTLSSRDRLTNEFYLLCALLVDIEETILLNHEKQVGG